MPDPRQLISRIVAALQNGKGPEARSLASDWQRHAPQAPDASFWLATAHLACGEPAKAVPLLERVLRAAPGNVDVLNNLGVALRQLGRADEALARFQKAVQLAPGHAEAQESVAQLLRAKGDAAGAVAHYLEAVKAAPGFRGAWFGLAECLRESGRALEAASVYQQYLQSQGRDALAWNNLGVALQQAGQLQAGTDAFARACAIDPEYAEALSHLAAALHDLGRTEEALPRAERAAKLRPDQPHIVNNLAVVLLGLNRPMEALQALEQTVRVAPDYFDAQHNFGNALHATGRTAEAITHLRALIAKHPEQDSAAFNLSTLLLVEGQWEEGWTHYERRPSAVRPRFAQPAWDGRASLEGKTLLLHAEQGLGDTLQFARYAPLLRERGATVIFEVQPSLLPVLEPLRRQVTLVAAGSPLPPFDEHLPLLSAPGRLCTRAGSFPPAGAIVAAPTGALEQWRARLGLRTRPRIGLVWAGNPAHLNDRNRSLPLSFFVEAFQGLPIEVFCLQKEIPARDTTTLASWTQAVPLGASLKDFGDTAAVLKLVDLLISVDTSVAHMGASLHVPTWILVPEPPDWRWLRGRTDSPWYPSVRLFRQPKPGDWKGLEQTLNDALASALKTLQPSG